MHKSVLLKESLELLDIKEGDVYLDATVGEGGHLESVYLKYGRNVTVAGIDIDPYSISLARVRLEKLRAEPKLTVLNFRDIDKAPEILGIPTPSKILFDLGWSKSQFEDSGKGFSFEKDEPLDMRLGETNKDDNLTAYDIVNSWEEENLKTIFSAYGEERFAGSIAKMIVETRSEKPLKTTFELVKVIKNATPLWYHFKRINPATKTFQALRIAVNDELQSLENGLRKSFYMIPKNGRIAVISFHSLEDRIVKRFFKGLEEESRARILTKKPVTAGDDEIAQNPRSRSGKLRGIEKQ